MQSREYQENSIIQIREKFSQGYRKVMLWLATGGGKTFIFCRMIKEASSRGMKCIVVVRGRKLVDQASQRLMREQVNHGVLMAGHWNYRPTAPVQVCSIDTLISRGLRPEADLIVIDEAHLATSDGYKMFLMQYPESYIVSVTATPWTDKSLRHIADEVVHPITMQGLIDEGHLVPFRYFAPSEPDVSGVKISSSTKDYVTGQLANVMTSGQLTGKIIDHWLKIASGLPTVCFAVNVNHSKYLTEKFNNAGIPAEHCDADVPDKERNEIISRVESGETKVICNVGIFTTGVDIPSLGAIIMARPTKSRNLFIQMAGRGTRLFAGKEHCILLDHAGCLNEHGFPTDEPEVDLFGRLPRESHKKESKVCKNCFAVYRAAVCPECGVVPPTAPEREIVETADELREISDRELDPLRAEYKALLRDAKRTGKKPAWANYRMIDKHGYEVVKPYLPQWFIDHYERGRANLFAKSPWLPGI